MTVSTDNKFAVVGMGGVFPDATNVERYWSNILEKRVSIEPIPSDCVEREVFFRPETHSLADKQDRSYTDLRATVKQIDFDAGKFRIPPKVASRLDFNQKLSLIAAEQAMAFDGLKSVSKERVSVIMGNTMIGQLHHDYVERFGCDKFEFYLRQQGVFKERLSPDELTQVLTEIRKKIIGDCPSVTEDTAPGVLPNIIAARINSVFDLHGHAYTVDAACASGLAAIICGIQQLKLGEADAVLCGASDFLNQEVGRIYFSGIGALSPDGSFPFDERANGFVVGDGAGVVIIKRLDDALQARDRILGIVTGYGQVSDGKGKAIAAPNELWQANAIRRAWEMAKVHPEHVELIEAHGTSTQVGDQSEVNALKRAFAEMGARSQNYCGIGSVKSNIGHLKSAAGIAGFIKALLSLDRKVLPPTAGFRKENPKLDLAASPFFVLSEAKEWLAKEHPRYAGVSAFGFGGADYHVALEEYREQDFSGSRRKSSACVASAASFVGAKSSAPSWPLPLCFSAADPVLLLTLIERFSTLLSSSNASLFDLVTTQNLEASARARVRLAFPVRTATDFQEKAEILRQWVGKPSAKQALWAKGIAFESAAPIDRGAVAVLFPGQGSQYADMLREVVERFASAAQVFKRADRAWHAWTGRTVTELIDSSAHGKEATDTRLKQTQHTHPSVFATSLALYRVLDEMGLSAANMVGHSVGEFTALAAAGRLSFKEALKLVAARATAFSEIPAQETGAMLALACNEAQADTYLRDSGALLAIANVNGPMQTIVSGAVAEIEKLTTYCARNTIKCVRLNVSHAFHSPLMEKAEIVFQKALHEAAFLSGASAVIANRSNEFYRESADSVRAELSEQITGSVRFATSIERLYENGVRLFVEVGPSSVLAQLVREILKDRDVTVLSSDNRHGDSVEAFVRTICGLFAAGVDVDPNGAPLARAATKTDTSESRRLENDVMIRSKAMVDVGETLTIVPPISENRKTIVYSGVSVGLPGSFKKSFRDDNFEQLFEGRNLIERLTEEEQRRLVDLRITKVVKSEQGAAFATLSTLNEVIQLAGKVGKIELDRDYAISDKDIATMSSAVAHAVAAGYEALSDANIPLVHEYTRTAGGTTLPERWALPKEMQRHTGVIFANGFPIVEPIIQEVSRFLSYRLGSRLREDILEFYDSLIVRITDKESRKLLSDWYALNHNRISPKSNEEEVYRFNHQLMTQIAMQANNRLARFVNARGPNFQVNAACSSTSTAITLAEELIRSGRAKRIIVIGADDPSSESVLPYLGAGFLSTGACTNAGDLYEAALPFDKRRNGMIMGAGAVGIVVEEDEECKRRGIAPVCELMGSHCFNTAGHPSQLDVPRYAEELEMFMTRMESIHRVPRKDISEKLVYLSHETYTPARGGCSEAEAVALRHVFGDDYTNIEISNTKGMTGHTMGAAIEDAVAAKSLQFGKAPPVVNHRVPDPVLEGLRLGVGKPSAFEYALRMAAGFGSQGNYILLKRRAQDNTRIVDKAVHEMWLTRISGLERAQVSHQGRVLIVKDEKPGSIVVDRPAVDTRRRDSSLRVRIPANPVPNIEVQNGVRDEHVSLNGVKTTGEARAREHSNMGAASERNSSIDVSASVIDVVAKITGYDPAILELDMELEADLGIDTVKQATVLATLAERLNLSDTSRLKLSEYPTLRSIVGLFGVIPNSEKASSAGELVAVTNEPYAAHERQRVVDVVLDVLAKVTGYGKEILGEDMELEADLGVDTVKQATVLSSLAERFGFTRDAGLTLGNFSTIRKLVDFFASSAPSTPQPSGTLRAVDSTKDDSPPTELRRTAESPNSALGVDSTREQNREKNITRSSVLDKVLEVIADVTGYAREMLDEEMELEADLGIDTVKQATVLSLLGERLGLERDGVIALSMLRSIRQFVDLFYEQGVVGLNAASVNLDPVENGVEKSESILSELYRVIGSTTPYPEEMLEPELKMGSDLELSPAIRDQIKAEFVRRLRLSSAFSFPVDASLGEIARLATETKSVDLANCETEFDNVFNGQALGRQVLALRPAPRGSANAYDFLSKRLWIVGDDECKVVRLAERLNAMGCRVGTLIVPGDGAIEELRARLEALLSLGSPKILVDLTCIDNDDTPEDDPNRVIRSMSRVADCRFVLCKTLTERKVLIERVLVVTAIDGGFGLSRERLPQASAPLYGLTIGLYKAVRKEWTNCHLSILDLEPKDWETDGTIALQLIERELAVTAAGVEVCYLAGERYRIVSEDRVRDTNGPRFDFDTNDVIVITGGGAGITAQFALELGHRYRSKFALIGRTELEPRSQNYEFTNEIGRANAKSMLTAELAESGGRVTPAAIEQAFARFERSAEIFQTLARLRQLGLTVQYYQADVGDIDAMRMAVEDIRRRLGPITALIHGAGVDKSHRIEQKSLEEFRRVYSVKALGAYLLEWLCRNDPLRRIIAISSISSRYGNYAQADYCAGNSFLDLKMRTNRRANIHAKSLLWSGFSHLGMAWRNHFVREHAERKGLNFISPDSGVMAAISEMTSDSGPAEVVLHRGLSDVADREQVEIDLSELPFIDWVDQRAGVITATHRRFSPRRDVLLEQHRFAGVPFMPGVGFMEMMAETAALLGEPQDPILVYEDLAFLDGFKLHREEPRDVRIDVSGHGSARFEMRVRSPFKPKLGSTWELRDYARASVRLVERPRDRVMVPNWSLRLTESAQFAKLFEDGKRRQQNVQLGPLFNDAHRSVETSRGESVRWSRDGIETLVGLPQAQLEDTGYSIRQYRLNPAFADAVHQAGAVLAILLTDEVYLPVGAERFIVYEAPNRNEVHRVTAKLKTLDENEALYDIVMSREDGTCCIQVTNARFLKVSA